jgi:hypothetical protein
MSFEIRFELFRPCEDDPDFAWGHFILGQSVERFRSSIGYWKHDEYRHQWMSELQRIVDGEDKGNLIVDLPHPKANSIGIWAMWRFDEEVVFHEQLIVPTISKTPFDPNRRWEIGEYGSKSDDGMAVSEWRILTSDIKVFLEKNRTPDGFLHGVNSNTFEARG